MDFDRCGRRRDRAPDDETYAKFDFYAAHGVEEIITADPDKRLVLCFRLAGTTYVPTDRSDLLGLRAADLTSSIDWP